MNPLTIYERVLLIIQDVSSEYQLQLPLILKSHRVVDDLGFSSLEVAVLTARLEIEFHCEPFSNGDVPITDIRTVGQIAQVYENVLQGRAASDGLFETAPLFEVKRRKRRFSQDHKK